MGKLADLAFRAKEAISAAMRTPTYQSVPAPPPASYIEAPPVQTQAPPIQTPPPPLADDPAVLAMLRNAESVAADPEATMEDIASAYEQLLQVAEAAISYGHPDTNRRVASVLGRLEEILSFGDDQFIQELPLADVQRWPEEYLQTAIPEADVHYTPGSSNVYSFVWVSDEHTVQEDGGIMLNPYGGGRQNKEIGTLLVTFKDWKDKLKMESGQRLRVNSPGATYAYANVPKLKYDVFASATSPDSAGHAVWDYLRIRRTRAGHQHPYRLISVTGEYVPRIATPEGYMERDEEILVLSDTPGEEPWFKAQLQSTLRPQTFARREEFRGYSGRSWNRQRGYPNRGTPNRGRP